MEGYNLAAPTREVPARPPNVGTGNGREGGINGDLLANEGIFRTPPVNIPVASTCSWATALPLHQRFA